MKTLYLECNMGAAGDMLAAALLELHPDPEGFLRRVNALGLPGVRIAAAPCVKCGITGTHVSVTGERPGGRKPRRRLRRPLPQPSLTTITTSMAMSNEHPHEHEHGHHDHDHEHEHGHHHHAGMGDIRHILSHLDLPQQVREDVLGVYQLIGEAESRAHGMPVEEIHFHEVGTLDAVADVTMVCLLLHELAPPADLVLSHPRGAAARCAAPTASCRCPLPPPRLFSRGCPPTAGPCGGSCAPPRAPALLKHFVTAFGPAPVMAVEQVGIGMGTKDFEGHERPAGHAGPDQGGAPGPGGGALLQPGRHDPRGHRLRPGGASGRRGPGRLHHPPSA